MTKNSVNIVQAIVDFERHFGDGSSKQFCIRWNPSSEEVIDFMKHMEIILPEGTDFGPELPTDFVFGLAFRVEKDRGGRLQEKKRV